MQKRHLCLALLAAIPFLLTGCLSERLTARMEYLSHKSLASYHVNTPDPYLDDPPMGQQILISWHLPSNSPYFSPEKKTSGEEISRRPKQPTPQRVGDADQQRNFPHEVVSSGNNSGNCWELPKEFCCDYPALIIKITVRFGNNEETVKCLKLEKNRGLITYRLINEEYFCKCGIRTYKVELIGNGQVLECWHHQLWAELITFE